MQCEICGKEKEHDPNVFVAVIQTPKGRTVRLNLKWTDLPKEGPPMFSYQQGSWFIVKGLERWINGHATWFYNSNDARPLFGEVVL